MADLIRLLPDSLANRIAAGEVIQRPASVVKELIENSVDAGADKITVNIKEAGRTLIQVIDNGCGMSETDARMSFERHATSKIKCDEDLFCIYTKGFRGEALASIASVAEVELKTRKADCDTGTQVIIRGGEFVSQSPINTGEGTNFSIKSLFFNVPARRKFLKANSTEFRHIITEFIRVALTHPQIEFQLIHNDGVIYDLRRGSLKQRIINVFGKSLNSELIPVNIDTSIVKISGFTGKPLNSRNKSDKQFFFVNNRFMKNSYFHKAVQSAYSKLINGDAVPPYFLYFEVDPHNIDVNIHPQKTEINFENGVDIFHLLMAGIKETLTKCDVVPRLEMDMPPEAVMPYFSKDDLPDNIPQTDYNPYFNPFEQSQRHIDRDYLQKNTLDSSTDEDNNMSELFGQSSFIESSDSGNTLDFEETEAVSIHEQKYLQLKNKYILTPVKSGLMIMDRYRAHQRILFEEFLNKISENADSSQKLLYPVSFSESPDKFTAAFDINEELASVGFLIDYKENNTYVLTGIPSFLDNNEAVDILDDMLQSQIDGQGFLKSSIVEMLASAAADIKALQGGGRNLEPKEIQALIDGLFATSDPNRSPSGKSVVVIMELSDIEKRFL